MGLYRHAPTWRKRKQKVEALRSSGKVVVQQFQNRIHVICPQNDRFSQGAKELSGRWKRRSMVWSFPLASERIMWILIRKVFGESAGKESV